MLSTLLALTSLAASPAWSAEIALQAPDKLGGCAIGDLDPRHPGNEVAALCRDGSVYVVHRTDEGWTSEVVFGSAGELIQCAVGDAIPSRPGDELIAVGMALGKEDDGGAGAAFAIYEGDGGWRAEIVHESDALIHGVCITDDGVWLTGFDRTLQRAERTADGWVTERAAALPGAGKSAVGVEGGVAVACTDGSIVRVVRAERGFRATELDRREAGRSRLGTDGRRVLSADDDGALTLVGRRGARTLCTERAKLRGAVLADLDPQAPGLEAATAGYAGAISLLYERGEDWEPVVVFRDLAPFHHLAAGELGGGPGLELAGCGFTGRLVVLTRTGGQDG